MVGEERLELPPLLLGMALLSFLFIPHFCFSCPIGAGNGFLGGRYRAPYMRDCLVARLRKGNEIQV